MPAPANVDDLQSPHRSGAPLSTRLIDEANVLRSETLLNAATSERATPTAGEAMKLETPEQPVVTRHILSAGILLLTCAVAIVLSSAIWIAGLTACTAGVSVLAMYQLRRLQMRDAKLLTLVATALTLTIALMSFGLATLNKGPGLIVSSLLLVCAVMLLRGALLMRPTFW